MSRHMNELPNRFELPHRLRRLSDLAYNLWWTWQSGASSIFSRLDSELWQETYHNPVLFLRQVPQQRFKQATQDPTYLAAYDRFVERFDSYMAADAETWAGRRYPDDRSRVTAYFSTEYGLHETLPIYAGGLGILSGDHLKEASDLGLPFAAVGFLYTQGFFSQSVNEDGWQQATYVDLSFNDLPVFPVTDEEGERLTFKVDLRGQPVAIQLWRIQVGRVPLYLLDTNFEPNSDQHRGLTARLYTSDLELRLAQEVVLGIGGVRALRTLGYNPSCWHMNEGHSAFLILELLRERVLAGESLDEAKDRVREQIVFTTHTPVAAGHDEFPIELMDKYFKDYWPQMGLGRKSFIKLAHHEQPWGEAFSMAILALRHAGRSNGVSKLHGEVARQMWSFLWPERTPTEVPITHITNGVHTGTWLAAPVADLLDEYLVPEWRGRVDDPEIWQDVDRIPDERLWGVRRHLKRNLVAYARERVRRMWVNGEIHPVQVVASGALLDPNALTIGFARRFATYKRADLILSDMDRLLRLINHPGRPVQVIFSGKAHPADEPGKRLIQAVYREIKRAENGGRLVFIEDYDMNVARYLLHGVDVWLNNPRRPNEASGTSGQKAALNGVINFSVLDGWWAEGYNGRNGWAIGEGQEFDSDPDQDEADADDLYRILEEEIIPLYYMERSADDLPGEWLGMVKQSMRTLAPAFSMRRMVKEYADRMYLPSAESQPG